MVTLCKVQLCLLIGCAVLWMDIADGKSVPAKDLETAASNKKSNKKYFSNGDGTENDNGYSKSSEDKGTGGYDKYETFHKDDGDSYAYEKHEGHGNNKKGKCWSYGLYEGIMTTDIFVRHVKSYRFY